MKLKNRIINNNYHYYRKAKRFYCFIISTISVLAGLRTANYEYPPDDIIEIGFYDFDILLHVENKYRYLINPDNLYEKGEYRNFKKNKVKLAYDGDILLIKKKFNGYRRFFELDNEVRGLNKLSITGIVPSIKYVDYRNCTIFIEYIDGINLSKGRKNIACYFKANSSGISEEIFSKVHEVHNKGIVLGDASTRNLILYDNDIYVIDFSEAVFFNNLSSLSGWKLHAFTAMKKDDLKKINNDINKILEKA
ncbi:MAG TPA: lipopolysaccharide core heptose(II) kinase RfaY [Sphingobacterium sp.]|nr:lipopolysaccharide core heptose(II) kinase RfaY [Sphingobacterium sp.]